MSIRIVTDSCCDIPLSTAEELDITIVPVVVNFGTETYTDFDLSRDEFWRMTEEVCHPQSSQPPVGAFVEAFKPLVEAGHEVVCVTVTGKMSGTFNSASTAAQQFGGRVTIMDSLALSWGIALQALAAREAAESGRSVQEIREILVDLRERTRMFLLFDTIEYLERGGRASRAMPAIKRVIRFLGIKPLLTVVEGELKLLGAVRSYQKGLERLQEEVVALGPLETLAVVHIRRHQLAQEFADWVSEQLGYPRENIVIAETGPGLSCHGGPGVMGLLATPKPSEEV